MEKTLFYLRHTELDGPDGSPPPPLDCVADFRNPGPEGLKIAEEAGRRVTMSGTKISHLFDGYLTRTPKTGLAFCRGLGYVPELHPAIPAIWDDAVYRDIDTPKYRALVVAAGKTKLEAVLRLCSPEQVVRFSDYALSGVKQMLNQMGGRFISHDHPDIVGVAFGHDPIILLAALALYANPEKFWALRITKLGVMEGMAFTENSRNTNISVRHYKP